MPIQAQALVDGFTSLGLVAFAAVLLWRQGRTMIERRLAFLFGTAGLFYAVRAGFHWTGSTGFEQASRMLASLLPLGALIVVETLLRRHAPRLLKVAMAGGAVVSLAAAATGFWGASAVLNAVTVGYVVGGLAAVVLLLLLRRRSGLSPQENATLAAVGRGLAALALLSVTDFGLGPLGVSGLGVLTVAYSISIGAYGPRRWQALAGIAGIVVGLSVALTLGLHALGVVTVIETAAAVTAAMAALALVLRLRAAPGEARRRQFLRAMVEADRTDLPSFIETLLDEPLLKGLVVLEGEGLARYDLTVVARLFERSALWTHTALAAITDPGDRDGAEQIADMLGRNGASYAVLLSASPLRIGLVASGPGGRSEDDEVELLIFHRLAASIEERA